MIFEKMRGHLHKPRRLYRKHSGDRNDAGSAGYDYDFSLLTFGTDRRPLLKAIQLLSICVFLAACSNATDTDESHAVSDDRDSKSKSSSNDDSYVPPDAEPIEAVDFEWTWVDVPEAICRDGSPTGFAVNVNSGSDKVMLYYEGGGACYNSVTCAVSPLNASRSSFVGQQQGLFNRDRDDNPVKDWNFVYFPYCSGDVFAGNSRSDPGIGEQQFQGYRNLSLFLDRVVVTFPEVTQVFAAGVSAGAIGVGTTAEIIAEKFPPDVKFSTIADSCPPMDAQYVPACLQKQWRELWDFDSTFLADCGEDCPDPNNFMIDIVAHLLTSYDDREITAGVLTSTEDPLIRFFYGFGNNDCNPDNPALPQMPAEKYKEGVMDMRNRLGEYTRFGTFFFDGADHVWINSDDKFYNLSVDGVRLVDWARDIIDGNVSHVGP